MSSRRDIGIDCGSVSLNLALVCDSSSEPLTMYRRTGGRSLEAFVHAVDELIEIIGGDCPIRSALVTGSGREWLSRALDIPSVNEISAHAAGALSVNPRIRTIIEIGGQDSKFIRIEPSSNTFPKLSAFRMNEICAAGTGAFLDEQAGRLGIPVESFGRIALTSSSPAPIAGRCAVFAKTDMIHRAQEGAAIPDILLGLAYALVRNYSAALIRGAHLEPLISLQGGVMANEAVVFAFKRFLGLSDDHIIVPPHFNVLGAIGCARTAARRDRQNGLTLLELRRRASEALGKPYSRSSLPPLRRPRGGNGERSPGVCAPFDPAAVRALGLDVGSVSVKGVVLDEQGSILREDYRLSRSQPLERLSEVIEFLLGDGPFSGVVAVTGSGRQLAGRLIGADLIVNEIGAQAAAARHGLPDTDTVVEIGGQDSKWIRLEEGALKDFEMNRVCAAGTGSFLMEQADRLNIPMGREFSDAAFAAEAPADLGARCTVFMESDLIHHQNSGASPEDLAAGVCHSVVRNYVERVVNNKGLGQTIAFLGGVAANPAVRAAFEQQTGRAFHTPAFHRVSGALGAALKAIEQVPFDKSRRPRNLRFNTDDVRKESFRCNGCPNRCSVDRYRLDDRTVYHGGLCDKWEAESEPRRFDGEPDLFHTRPELLRREAERTKESGVTWGMIRSPQYFEWFPFWNTLCAELGIALRLPGPPNRSAFERGLKYVKVETCLPMKVLAGQIAELSESGVTKIFHPVVLSEAPTSSGEGNLRHCAYIQGLSQFFRGTFDIEWKEPFISYEFDPDAMIRGHARFFEQEGFSRAEARAAVDKALAVQEEFDRTLRREGERALSALGPDETALVVLGKPYHNADPFLNMSVGRLIRRLGVRALPSDVFPISESEQRNDVPWKYQSRMEAVARRIADDPRLFPVMITFFGCGPDPFTIRHIREALGGKPLLILEMDEHTSKAGVVTRLEAFLEQIGREAGVRADDVASERAGARPATRERKPEALYLPYMADHSYGFAAAARSVGVDAQVLAPPDEESLRLGWKHMVGGECHPYALILGDYLKLVETLSPDHAERGLFYCLGPDACRLEQYPAYIEKVRKDLGCRLPVVSDIGETLRAFGLSEKATQRVLLKAWEGLNAYDLLMSLFYRLHPIAADKNLLERTYGSCRDKLFDALAEDNLSPGMEEVLNDLHAVPIEEREPRPLVAITGDYYTRVVPYANNNVYREVERLGGTVLTPPTFTDAFKLGRLQEMVWFGLEGGRKRRALGSGLLYAFMAYSEYKVKGGACARRVLGVPLDISGRRLWKRAGSYTPTQLPPGITAPLATCLHQVEQGADGVLNLITLNCSFGTVVTAALARALEDYETPMLTLVFDGLKQTNEKTRLEAFMEQVKERFNERMDGGGRGASAIPSP